MLTSPIYIGTHHGRLSGDRIILPTNISVRPHVDEPLRYHLFPFSQLGHPFLYLFLQQKEKYSKTKQAAFEAIDQIFPQWDDLPLHSDKKPIALNEYLSHISVQRGGPITLLGCIDAIKIFDPSEARSYLAHSRDLIRQR